MDGVAPAPPDLARLDSLVGPALTLFPGVSHWLLDKCVLFYQVRFPAHFHFFRVTSPGLEEGSGWILMVYRDAWPCRFTIGWRVCFLKGCDGRGEVTGRRGMSGVSLRSAGNLSSLVS